MLLYCQDQSMKSNDNIVSCRQFLNGLKEGYNKILTKSNCAVAVTSWENQDLFLKCLTRIVPVSVNKILCCIAIEHDS